MTDDKRKTRAAILQELESIQGLLLDDDIPLLQEIVETGALDAGAEPEPVIANPTRPSLKKATGENPFLPQHIRERLKGNNPPPNFQLEPSPNLLAKPPKTAKPATAPHSRQTLIKHVIESLQADIERELQQKLEQLSNEALQQLLTPED